MNSKPMIPPKKIINNFVGSEEEVDAFNHVIESIYYQEAESLRDQVGCLCNFLRCDQLKVSYERIGKVYGESAHCIWDQHKNYLRGNRSDGRPSALRGNELVDIRD